jgi:uncharacterized membrane protein (DUF485 family)
MDAGEVVRIRNSPAFLELERKRSVFSWSLAIFMMLVYGAFTFLVAFDHSIVAQVIGGGPLTLAFPLGLGVIAVAIISTGIYVIRANTEFDRLTAEIVEQSYRAATPIGARFVENVR